MYCEVLESIAIKQMVGAPHGGGVEGILCMRARSTLGYPVRDGEGDFGRKTFVSWHEI